MHASSGTHLCLNMKLDTLRLKLLDDSLKFPNQKLRQISPGVYEL